MEIEKNIPIPRPNAERGKYPFHKMEIGDSFVVPIDSRGAVVAAGNCYKKKHGMRFTTRRTECGQFVRIWRIA